MGNPTQSTCLRVRPDATHLSLHLRELLKAPFGDAENCCMRWNTGEPSVSTARAASRYNFAVPMSIELANGLFRAADHIDAYLVDLSHGGAGLVLPADPRLRVKKRYRVLIDDHSGIIEVRNIAYLNDDQVRLGVAFKSLGLELQELVADSLATARVETSRLAK